MITQTVQRGTDAAKKFYTRYNDKGYLARIERDSLTLWQANRQDAANRVLEGQYGNGLKQLRSYNVYTGRLTSGNVQTSAGLSRLQETYQYNAIGNVQLRGQYWDINGFSETFEYDNLNRISNSTVTSAAGVQATQLFTYDAAGSILSKTGVGSGNYLYPVQGATAVRPHAVTSIPSIGSFGYDANGNQTSGAGKLISWTSFDMPDTITKGTQSSHFTYGPEHQRTRQDKLINNTNTGNIVYGGSQEVEFDAGSNTRTVKTYWPAGLGVEIEKVNTITNAITTATTYNWTHLDRLGSPIAISDDTGALKEKLAYDAWGKRRTLDGAPISGSATPDTIDGQTDNKGFTGHEMLDQLDLVHMNGRVYDPLTAKFLSGDPLIQDPTNGQNYNRYAYVLNNPTNLTDPTGFAISEYIPVYGNVLDFQEAIGDGRFGAAAAFGILAIVDGATLGVGSLVTAPLKALTKSAIKAEIKEAALQVGKEGAEQAARTSANVAKKEATKEASEKATASETKEAAKGTEKAKNGGKDEANVTSKEIRSAGKAEFEKQRENTLKRNDGICEYCNEKQATQQDHIKSIKEFANDVNSGKMTKQEAVTASNKPENLAGSCGGKGGCNPTKSANELSDTPGKGKYVPSNPVERITEIIMCAKPPCT